MPLTSPSLRPSTWATNGGWVDTAKRMEGAGGRHRVQHLHGASAMDNQKKSKTATSIVLAVKCAVEVYRLLSSSRRSFGPGRYGNFTRLMPLVPTP